MSLLANQEAPRVARTSRLTLANRQALTGYLLVVPALALLLALVAYPFFFAISISFTDRVVGQPGNWIGLDNFRYLSQNPSFLKTIQNTIIMVVVSDILKLFIGLGLAMLLNQAVRGRGLMRAVILLPWAMPGFVAFLVWKLLYMPIGGAFNQILTKTNIYPEIIDYLGQRSTALPAVILATTWRGFPFWAISFLAALQGVPGELYEAAKVDGASSWQRFWDITLPSIKPVILIVVLMSSIWTANSFENIWIMTQGGPSDATMVFPVLAYFGMQSQRLGEAAAVSVAMIPALLILVFFVTWLVEDDD
ncbi:MAG: sugar ABC transporter permease [Chloroflexia bacterium]|nr:sugar ABC transporter permease [Chloroflexia bacterium]